MPPRWALGFLQSTRHFEDTQLRRLGRTLREKRIPCDALIFLSSYGDALGWNRGVGHLEFEPTLWPDPAAILEEMHAQHFEVVTHEYPVVHEESPLFAEAHDARLSAGGGLPERASATGTNYRQGQRYVDFSDPAARVVVVGAPRARSARRGGVVARRRRGSAGRVRIARRPRNAPAQHLRSAPAPGVRRGGGARSARSARVPAVPIGAAGMQRFGASCWSGDINNDFATLEAQIPLRPEHGHVRDPVLGHRRGRLLPSDSGDRRALRALVPARRLQPDLPVPRMGLARARSLGARERGRGDLPSVCGAALSAAPLHLHPGLAGSRWGSR